MYSLPRVCKFPPNTKQLFICQQYWNAMISGEGYLTRCSCLCSGWDNRIFMTYDYITLGNVMTNSDNKQYLM